jgi:hypothetical protein
MLAGSMVVALWTADWDDIHKAFLYLFNQPGVPDDFSKVPSDVTAFAYLLYLGWLVTWGAGFLSLDRVLRWGLAKGADNEARRLDLPPSGE